MPEAPFTGLTGSVKIGPQATAQLIGYISGIDLDLDKEIIEVIQFGGDGYKKKVPAIKDWKATADGTAAFATGGQQAALLTAYENGTEIILGIYLDDTTYFEGTALVKNLKISGKADGKFDLSCGFEGSGAVVLTMPAE
jgi:predicted secreted protein